MKETKYQELKKEIAELKEKQEYYDEYITKGIDPFIEKIAELEERLDTWDRRLAKWARKMELEE